MTIKLTEGCNADSLTIDGTEEFDLTPGQRQWVAKRVMRFLLEHDGLNGLLVSVASQYGDPTIGPRCEQCGDTTITYTLEIED